MKSFTNKLFIILMKLLFLLFLIIYLFLQKINFKYMIAKNQKSIKEFKLLINILIFLYVFVHLIWKII